MTLSTPRYIGTHVSRDGARKQVSRGVAVWACDGRAIRYRLEDHRVKAASASMVAGEFEAMGIYDHTARSGNASLAQLRGLPMLGDLTRMLKLDTTYGNGDRRGVFKNRSAA